MLDKGVITNVQRHSLVGKRASTPHHDNHDFRRLTGGVGEHEPKMRFCLMGRFTQEKGSTRANYIHLLAEQTIGLRLG